MSEVSSKVSSPKLSLPPSHPLAPSQNGKNALHLAAERGQKTSVRLLLDCTTELAAKDARGQTALHLAVENRHEVVAQYLVRGGSGKNSSGGELDVQDNEGQTALHIAVRTGQVAMVQLLLRAKADLEVRDKGGRTALHLAVLMGEEGILELLLDGKADPGAKMG